VTVARAFKFAVLGVMVAASAQSGGLTDTHRYLEIDGTKLYTEILGHGPPVLFLPGGMLSFDSNFAHQRDYFARYRTVIGIDQRGQGHSPDGPWQLSYELMANDTAEVIRRLGLGPVDVIGHSDGGDVALLLARDHPELVRRVVISGANLRSGLTPAEAEARSRMPAAQLARKLQQITTSMPKFIRADYSRVSPDGPDHWMVMLEKCYRMWINPVVIDPADLKKIRAPVLVIAGDRDFTSIEETVEIYRGLPHAQLMIVPGTGHGTFVVRSELLNPVIREFLDATDASAGGL
jgi:pimeloyl-ACP methyl ester carboxylesterase